jgi:UDP-4-amino-4,6-dideoxy-N-acetyl-beta-L-altrosamine transaminase
MSQLYLPYNRQCLDRDDIQAVVDALHGDLLTGGSEVSDFEVEIAEAVGARYAVVCANGTAALHMAMMALGVGRGDNVLTTPITFVADANVSRFVGADVVFADVCASTANLDPVTARKTIATTPGLKAMLLVHFAGQPVQMEAFAALSSEFNVPVVEDACHALGAEYQDGQGRWHRVGSCAHSIMTTFSFHPIKNITTGEGGCVTTNDPNLYHKLKQLRSHGTVNTELEFVDRAQAFTAVNGVSVQNPWYYEMQTLGFNYRLSDFQCALGRSQLRKLRRYVERRAALAVRYQLLIAERLKGFVMPLETSVGIRHAHHLFVIRMPFARLRGGRANLMRFLLSEGVATQVHYLPIYRHPYYKRTLPASVNMPIAERYYDECLSLPLFPCMDEQAPERVVTLLERGIHEFLVV